MYSSTGIIDEQGQTPSGFSLVSSGQTFCSMILTRSPDRSYDGIVPALVPYVPAPQEIPTITREAF